MKYIERAYQQLQSLFDPAIEGSPSRTVRPRLRAYTHKPAPRMRVMGSKYRLRF